MNDLISIIIPVYNVENYLSRCLNSVLCQSYKNIEIIIVDDGSEDNSSNICATYANKDLRFKIYHKENGGLSSARNLGIVKATGEWLYFLDSDDWISPNTIFDLLKGAQENKCEIAMGSLIFCDSEDKFNKSEIDGKNIVYSKKDALYEMTIGNKFVFYACNRLYKKELFANVKFPVNKLYEDMYTIYLVVEKAEKICYIPQAKYAYYQRNDSIVNSSFSVKQMDWYYAVKTYQRYCINKYPEFAEIVDNLVIFVCISLLNKIIISENGLKNNTNEFEMLYLEIKKDYQRYMKSSVKCLAVNCKYKAAITLLMINKMIYCRLVSHNFK